MRLDGDTERTKRQSLIDEFNQNSGFTVFLLSTRAGGLGINLASADTIFIFDHDFNPHSDIQALSRAHRIGQSQKLMVYRLVTVGTVEEKIIEQASHKLMVEHMLVKNIKPENLYQVIKYGTQKIFCESGEDYLREEDQIPQEDLDSLLNRDSEDKEEEKENEGDALLDFLNSFQIANKDSI